MQAANAGQRDVPGARTAVRLDRDEGTGTFEFFADGVRQPLSMDAPPVFGSADFVLWRDR